jgi:hypothetical protein
MTQDQLQIVRRALILLAPAGEERQALKPIPCWCSPEYRVDLYGHSVGCALAREALDNVNKDIA